LENTTNSHFQLIGFDRHYYKVNARVGGVQSGNIQSVVITMNIIDGDRVAIIVADSPTFITFYDNLNTNAYNGWSRTKVCYFGECTIEISTRAQHPGVPILYVWVATVTTSSQADYRLEKPVNYLISATTGVNNCESNSNFVSGFCQTTVQSLTSVYSYRDVTLRNAEAQARFENFLCRCEPPTAVCLTALTRFSCLESFRECDNGGFWTPICIAECDNVQTACGPFQESDTTCACTRSEFACSNPRYSVLGTNSCTGAQPSATPSPAPSSTPTHTKAAGASSSSSPSFLPSGASRNPPVSHSPSASHFVSGATKSNSGTHSHSSSQSPPHSPSQHGGVSASHSSTPHAHPTNENTIIKYYIIYEQQKGSDASTLSNTFASVFAILLSLFLFF